MLVSKQFSENEKKYIKNCFYQNNFSIIKKKIHAFIKIILVKMKTKKNIYIYMYDFIKTILVSEDRK